MAITKDVQRGAGELVRIDGIGGMAAGVVAAPMVRSTVKNAAPEEWFAGEPDAMANGLFLLGQGIVGGMMAAGRLGRGGAVRAIGAGVAVEAVREAVGIYLGV
jgi:hypothetical protein